MKQKLIQKSPMLFIILSLFSINSFSQNNMGIADKCVIVLDVQNYSTLNPKISSQELIQNINSIIEKTKTENIIYVKTLHKVLYLTKKGFSVGLDTLGMELDNRLKIVNNNIILKYDPNVFTENKLTDFLQKNNFKDVIIIGLMAEWCVKESLIEGNNLGYNMYFIPEAIMGKSEKKKEKILNKMITKGIKQIPINELIN
jgi:nicotinamidase-related amidase